MIKLFDFIRNEDEPYVYKNVSESAVIFLILYIDKILQTGNDVPMLTLVKIWLSKEFFMKNFGEASYILRIKINEIDLKDASPLTEGVRRGGVEEVQHEKL